MPVPSWAVRKAKATAHAGPRFNCKLPVRAVPARTWHIGLARAVPSFAGNGTRYSGQCPLVPVLALRPRPKEAVAFRRSVPGLRWVQVLERRLAWPMLKVGLECQSIGHANRCEAQMRENFRSRSCSAFRFPFRRTPNPSSLPLFSPSPLPPDAQGAYAMNLKGVSASAR